MGRECEKQTVPTNPYNAPGWKRPPCPLGPLPLSLPHPRFSARGGRKGSVNSLPYSPLPAKEKGSPEREELTLGIDLINNRCVQVLIN